jgi:hypothetical protein
MNPTPGLDAALVRAGSEIAGYRVLRKLGQGARAEVYLAGVDDSFPVAVKVYREGVPDAVIGTELEALTRLDSEHVVRLLDVGRAPDGRPCLILERCPHGTLTDVLAGGRRIAAGEAVTILAPVAETIGALHALGVAHRSLSAGHVMFTRRGAPVLIGWGSSELFEAAAAPVIIGAQPGARADRAGLRALARAVIEVAEPAGPFLAWLDRQPDAAEFPGALAEQLFALAEPVAVRLGEATGGRLIPSAQRERAVSASQWESQSPSPASQPAPGAPHESADRPAAPWLAALALPGFLAAQVTAWTGRAVGLLAQLRRVRRRFWVVAAIPVALLIALVALLSAGEPRAADGPEAVDRTMPSAPAVPAELLGEDPVAAARVLVDTRNRCLQELSLLCLDAVLQPGSPAYTSDAAIIRAARDGGAAEASAPLGYTEPALVEQVGGSAIIRLGADSNPASLLMIRGEAGWRIRAYLDQAAESGQ